MGSTFAHDLAGLASNGSMGFDLALSTHLTSNCYPPVPSVMFPVAKKAVLLMKGLDFDDTHEVQRAGDTRLALPPGVSYRGSRHTTARAVIDAYHLHAFLD